MLPQRFFYPLYHAFDRQLFAKLQKAVDERYEFVGTDEDKIFFVKTLFYYQLLNKNYRKPLQIIHKNLAKRTNIRKINNLTKKTEFEEDLSWVIWLYEKEMVRLVKRFWRSKQIRIVGTNSQFNEFVLRYMVSIWLVDWAGPLFALLTATKNGVIDLKKCNDILSLWDFTGIFASYKQNQS